MRRAAVLVLFLSARLLFGWGVEGHRLVVRIADGMLAPATRLEIGRVLAPGESLAALASWADDVRNSRKETEPWHYIDIPIGGAGLDMKHDCPAGGCIISKIAEFRREWRDPAASLVNRREALLFLVHFAGDLHQPLHCANNHDKGGNDVAVIFRGDNTNLHALWDYGLLDHMAPEDQLLSAIRESITPERAARWSQGTVEEWAGESWRVAQNYVYGPLPHVSAGRPVRLGESYELIVDPIVRDQIAKAGVRLAAILNEGAH